MNTYVKPQIQQTSVLAEFGKPMLARTTRWDYVKGYIPLWKEAAHFEIYSIVLAIVAVYFLFFHQIMAVAVLAAAGAIYYHVLREQRISRLESSRKVIWSH
jgi:hypothetical protein